MKGLRKTKYIDTDNNMWLPWGQVEEGKRATNGDRRTPDFAWWTYNTIYRRYIIECTTESYIMLLTNSPDNFNKNWGEKKRKYMKRSLNEKYMQMVNKYRKDVQHHQPSGKSKLKPQIKNHNEISLTAYQTG